MTTLIAFHGSPAIKARPAEIIKALVDAGVLVVDLATGTVTSTRWPKPLGCRSVKGYLVCTLRDGTNRVQAKLHQIVWIAAGNSIPDGFMLDHVDRNGHNNRLSNLRLVTSKGNAANRRRYNGSANPAARIDRTGAERIRSRYIELRSYAKVAKEAGVSKSLVAQIVRGELWA